MRFLRLNFVAKCSFIWYNKEPIVFLTIISWLILIKVNEQPSLKDVVLKEARMGKDKPKDIPKFIYYRLIRGIQNMFAGVKRLFLFRLKRKRESKTKYGSTGASI